MRVGTLREHGDLDTARVDCLTPVNVCLLSAFAETAARGTRAAVKSTGSEGPVGCGNRKKRLGLMPALDPGKK